MEARMLISVDPSSCTGCRMCEIACSLHHTGECRPSRARIRVAKKEDVGIHVPVTCMQCSDAPCVRACPQEALYQDSRTGWVLVKEDLCIGCKLCHAACPVGAIHFPRETRKAAKCDLCGGQPRCVEFCEPQALQFTAEENFHRRKSAKILEAFSSSRPAAAKSVPTAGEVRI